MTEILLQDILKGARSKVLTTMAVKWGDGWVVDGGEWWVVSG